ncbi:MAG: heavy metal translocating P-type ATPase [Candidatus Electrothrix sp. AW2]|nr:heavy metal translocating P-type ATPase [Candidatus Electrothrix gigas]
MIHLAGVLFVSGGVAVAEAWPRVKTRIGLSMKSPEKQTTVQEKVVSEQTESLPDTVLTSGESEKNKYRLALSTGTMGIATCAQFGLMWLSPVSLVLTGFLSARIFKDTLIVIFKEKRIGVDILDSTVISLCILTKQFGPAALMVWVLDLADMLQEKSQKKSSEYLTEIFGKEIRSAWLLVDGQEIEVPLDNLKKGDIIMVSTGEQVPVDGIIAEGEAIIDQQSLTGESVPVEKEIGDEVFAMTVLVGGKINVRVMETCENTVASKIIQIISQASGYKVGLQSTGEKIADQMVIPTLALGAAGYFTTGTSAMLAIINADFGTGIRVAAPIALLASLGIAAKNGVLIKDGKVLELLKDIDAVLFDKTGTLTHDVPTVAKIVPANSTFNEENILFYAAAAEQKFSHPVAKAILHKAAQSNLVLPPHDESRYHVGLGIEVTVHEDLVKVGSARYMENEQISIPEIIQQALQDTANRGHTAILTAVNGEIAGMLELQSKQRDEAIQVMQLLKERGVKEVVLISGDHEAPTKDLANSLGMDRYFAGVLPHEKADYVRMLQDEGKKVMMVGDGINDSAALSYADISVSLHGASSIAVDVADVIFMDGTLSKFNYLFDVSDNLHQNVKRSFYLIAVPNTLCIAGAMMGFFGLASSLVLNNGFNLLAVANGTMPYFGANKASKVKNIKENN